ncbi:MAG: hypothetical protein WCX27_00255 [Candidatus Paceibacterota bacterium]|jgi:hypothetical protein
MGDQNKSSMVNFLKKLGVPEQYGNTVLVIFAIVLYIITAIILYRGLTS